LLKKGNAVSTTPIDPPQHDDAGHVPMLGYRAPIEDAPPGPKRATPGQLLVAFAGTIIYLLLTALFTLVLASVGRYGDPSGILCAVLPTLLCGWRAMAAIKVLVDHFQAK
jgi:hypothetical protein